MTGRTARDEHMLKQFGFFLGGELSVRKTRLEGCWPVSSGGEDAGSFEVLSVAVGGTGDNAVASEMMSKHFGFFLLSRIFWGKQTSET